MGTLLHGVDRIVDQQENDSKNKSNLALGLIYEKKLRDTESDLLLFEEREEQLNDMIDEKESNGSTNVKFLKTVEEKIRKM